MENHRFFERGPDLVEAVGHEIGGDAAGGEKQPGLGAVGAMNSKGGELGFGFQIVIQGGLRSATFSSATQISNGHGGLGVDGESDGAGIGVGLLIDPMHRIKDRIGLRNFPQWLAFCNPARLETKGAEFSAQRAFGRHRLWIVAFFLNESPPRLSGREAPIELGGAKGGIGLAGPFTHLPKVGFQIGK